MTGTIKTLTDRGFGFISREGEAKDLFFHSKDLQGVTFDELKQGDTVTAVVKGGHLCFIGKIGKGRRFSRCCGRLKHRWWNGSLSPGAAKAKYGKSKNFHDVCGVDL